MNRKPLVSGMLLMTVGSLNVAAADFTDTAEVISAAPIYDRVSEPHKECWQETVNEYQPRVERSSSIAAPIIGGVFGGLLGSRVGRGNGAKVATGAGAIAGAIVGNRLGEREEYGDSYATREVERCRNTTSFREVVTGYDVVYRYNGRDVRTRLPYDPGDTVKVGVGLIDGGRAPVSHRY